MADNLDSLVPKRIAVNEAKDCLSIHYQGDLRYQLAAEYLRVLSPSAEVRGHGPGQEVLQFGKRQVTIRSIAKSGNYAIQITFSDGHDSGADYDNKWAAYLETLRQAGQSRDPDTQVVKLV